MTTSTSNTVTWISRIALLVVAVMLCIAGVTGVFDPSKLSGDAILAPDGVTSVRVDYGGFHLGLGLFALLGVLNRGFLKPGLVAGSITMTLVIVMRLAGMSVDGVTDAQIAILSVEVIPFAMSILGLALLMFKGGPDTA